MGMLKDIYSAYSNGNLCVKRTSQSDDSEVGEFEERMKFSPEQREDFEDILGKQCNISEENGFFAGFRAAIYLITDVASENGQLPVV